MSWAKGFSVKNNTVHISFVVVTYNAENYINQCIESINDQFGAINDYNFVFSAVVIDNSSSDKTVDFINVLSEKYKWLKRICLTSNIGFGPANNVGISSVEADYYVLLNADAWFLADSVSPVVEIMEEYSEVAICGLPLVFPNGFPQTYVYSFSSWHRWLLVIVGVRYLAAKLIDIYLFSKIFQFFNFSREFINNQKKPPLDLSSVNSESYDGKFHNVDWVCGAAMVISNKFLKETGGFDPNIFLYGEDEDLCVTAHHLGYSVITADVSPVVHMLGWGGSGFNSKVSDLKYDSLRYFIGKNIRKVFPRVFMRIILPVYVYGYRRFYRAFSVNKRLFL